MVRRLRPSFIYTHFEIFIACKRFPVSCIYIRSKHLSPKSEAKTAKIEKIVDVNSNPVL
jgi:hypothetical protein